MVTLSSCLIWQIISFILSPNEYGCVYTWTTLGSEPASDLQKMPILAKKNHLGGYVNKQTCRIWGIENPHAYIEKPTHRKRITDWCGFWSRGIVGAFFFENEQGEGVTVGKCWTNFCSQKLKKRILVTFDIKRTALLSTQPKTHSMFAPSFERSHYKPQSWCRLATSKLRFDTVGLLFVGCRQR